MREFLLNQNRASKRMFVQFADFIVLTFALWLAFSIRLETLFVPSTNHLPVLLLGPLIAIPALSFMGVYRSVFRYVDGRSFVATIQGMSLAAAIWLMIVFMLGGGGLPRSVLVLFWFLGNALIFSSRFFASWWFSAGAGGEGKRRIAIYGAGSAGRQLANALKQSREFHPVIFIDDDKSLWNLTIGGVEVISPDFFFTSLAADTKKQFRRAGYHDLDEVFLAIPSASHAKRREIVSRFSQHSVKIRTLPGVTELADGTVKIEQMKEIGIDDLLGRDIVDSDSSVVRESLEGRVVMVTGAGGSIGSELCRQIALMAPKKLILFDQCEEYLYNIKMELDEQASLPPTRIRAVLGDVRVRSRLKEVMSESEVEVVFHAAAYKHVPLVESNPVQGISNNVSGTLNAALTALELGVAEFVLVSTDKAVRPTSVMGASKRVSEMLLQALDNAVKSENLSPAKKKNSNVYSFPGESSPKTCFSMVRFGNVLDSSGSVVPRFRKQIKAGGPITVTDPEVTRFFMTIPEAAQLVLQAGAMSTGGEVFVLDMGKPVKIIELARNMIRLGGFSEKTLENPSGDIEIRITGLRPGEKLYEELLIGETDMPTDHPMIFKAREEYIEWSELEGYLNALDDLILQGEDEKIRSQIFKIINERAPESPEPQDGIAREKLLR